MSVNALVLGTVDFLRDPTVGLALGAEQCDEQPDPGQPPPSAGVVYYAVVGGDFSNSATESLDEEYGGLKVVVTYRAAFAPADRVPVAVLREVRKAAERARARVHSSYDLMNLANARLQAELGADFDGFVEPLRFLHCGAPQAKGPDWFWAEGEAVPSSGVAVTVTFGKARRIQPVAGAA